MRYSTSPCINKSTKRFGFSLMCGGPVCFEGFNWKNTTHKYLFGNSVDKDNKLNDKMPEIKEVFSDNDKMKLLIDVKFNKTSSNEKKVLEKIPNLSQIIYYYCFIHYQKLKLLFN